MKEGTKEVFEDRSTNHDDLENDSNTSTQEDAIVRERRRKLSGRVSGSMGEGVRNNKEEVDGVRSKILDIEKRRENKPEERKGPGRISEVEGGREKRKRNREGGKEPEVMGSGTGGRR
jgi:hypothetical protein